MSLYLYRSPLQTLQGTPQSSSAAAAGAAVAPSAGPGAAPSWSVLSDTFSFGSTRLKEGNRGKEEAVAFDTDGLEIGEFSEEEEDDGEGEEEDEDEDEDEDVDEDEDEDEDVDEVDEDELDQYE